MKAERNAKRTENREHKKNDWRRWKWDDIDWLSRELSYLFSLIKALSPFHWMSTFFASRSTSLWYVVSTAIFSLWFAFFLSPPREKLIDRWWNVQFAQMLPQTIFFHIFTQAKNKISFRNSFLPVAKSDKLRLAIKIPEVSLNQARCQRDKVLNPPAI